MDIIRCSVCNEPIYTTDFKETLMDKLDEQIEPLCPAHRGSSSIKSWYQAATVGQSEDEKPK